MPDPRSNAITTKICFGFRGKKQLPLFMIIREYWQKGEVIDATVLFIIRGYKV